VRRIPSRKNTPSDSVYAFLRGEKARAVLAAGERRWLSGRTHSVSLEAAPFEATSPEDARRMCSAYRRTHRVWTGAALRPPGRSVLFSEPTCRSHEEIREIQFYWSAANR
jgi:hypothetical protein